VREVWRFTGERTEGAPMAVIAMFYGIIVSMYFFDMRRHHRPHVHVKYQRYFPSIR
jgi:hypothetical protein